MSTLLVLAVVLPAAGALVAQLPGPDRPRAAVGSNVIATALALALAVVLAVEVARGDVVATGSAALGLVVDRVGAVLLLLVFSVSVVVQAYAGRYLRGERRLARFLGLCALVTTATAALVTASTLVTLAAAWTLAGVGLCALLGHYPDGPAARQGVARARRMVLVGDGALWLGVLVASSTWGTLHLEGLGRHLGPVRAEPLALGVVACLVVVAALARSAQVPFQGWLPATLAAPTPVSALLHAGIVNAGGILLVRTSALFTSSPLAMALAFTLGALTTIYGTTLMLARPDVKGALTHSTMGQMGFMVMTCGIGAFAAAVFHLVAHGLYKAALFLGSGSAVRAEVRHRAAPPVRLPATGWRVTGSVAGSAVALVPPVLLLHPDLVGHTGGGALLVFAWASGGWALWGWLGRHPSVGGAAGGLAALLVADSLYLGAFRGFTSFLAPALAAAGTGSVPRWALVPVVVAVVLVSAVRVTPRGRRSQLHRRLYVAALSAGSVPATLSSRLPADTAVRSLTARPAPYHEEAAA